MDAHSETVGGEPQPEALREDIEATRARMGDTLEELGTRLNPERLKQEVKDTIHDATIGRVQNVARQTADRAVDAGRQVTHVARAKPARTALVAIGIGWVAWSLRKLVSLRR